MYLHIEYIWPTGDDVYSLLPRFSFQFKKDENKEHLNHETINTTYS